MMGRENVKCEKGSRGGNNMPLELKLYNRDKLSRGFSLIFFFRDLLYLSLFYSSKFFTFSWVKRPIRLGGGLKCENYMGWNNEGI
jgi:hypothetical protein